MTDPAQPGVTILHPFDQLDLAEQGVDLPGRIVRHLIGQRKQRARVLSGRRKPPELDQDVAPTAQDLETLRQQRAGWGLEGRVALDLIGQFERAGVMLKDLGIGVQPTRLLGGQQGVEQLLAWIACSSEMEGQQAIEARKRLGVAGRLEIAGRLPVKLSPPVTLFVP